MVALRSKYAGAVWAPFVLAAAMLVPAPTSTGEHGVGRHHQLTAAAPRAVPLWAPPGARTSLVRPIEVEGAEPPALQRSEAAGSDVTGSLPAVAAYLRDHAGPLPVAGSSVLNRTFKGDRLLPRAETDLMTASAHRYADVPDDETDTAVSRLAGDLDIALQTPPPANAEAVDNAEDSDSAEAVPGEAVADAAFGGSRLYFDAAPMGAALAAVEPWAAGDAPVLVVPAVAVPAVVQLPLIAPAKPPAQADTQPGVTVAGKGEVTGEGRRPMSPAEQLRLTAKSRVKAERCLANAVYFESRSEPVRGQIAVAQVVLNRAFSGYYPNDVCGVVYQGANRHLSCQFTFACDGIPDVVTDAESWERAKRISRAALDGKLWLNEIGKATHYHALYVNPYWVRSMRRLHRIGLHSFYRPRQWGSGVDAPSWGNPLVAEVVAKL
jgi:spore germination cell wall hydrolase CwlJ-like protein